MTTKWKIIFILIGILTLLILGTIIYFFPHSRPTIVSFIILMGVLAFLIWTAKQIGFEFIGSVILGITILIGVIYFLSMLPNPQRPQEELVPCEQALTRLDASGEIDCKSASKSQIKDLIHKHIEEFNNPDGRQTNWGDQLSDALLDTWPIFDYGHFSNILTEYDKEKGQFLSKRFVVTEQAKGQLLGTICLIPILGIFLSQVLVLVSRYIRSGCLSIPAKLIIPILAFLGFFLGTRGIYIPWIGALPTEADIEPIKQLFWTGFGIQIASTFLAGIALPFILLVVGLFNPKNPGTFLGYSVLYAITQGAFTAIGWGAIQGGLLTTFILNTLATNPFLTSQIAINAALLGWIFGITVIPLPQYFSGLLLGD